MRPYQPERESVRKVVDTQLEYGPLQLKPHRVSLEVRQFLVEAFTHIRGSRNPDGTDNWPIPEQFSAEAQKKILDALRALTEKQRVEMYQLTVQQDDFLAVTLSILDTAILKGRAEIPVEEMREAAMVNMLQAHVPNCIAVAIRPLMQEWTFSFSDTGQMEYTFPERYSNALLQKARGALQGMKREEIDQLRPIETYGAFTDLLLSLQQNPWTESTEAATIDEQYALLQKEWPEDFQPEERDAVRLFLHRIFQLTTIVHEGDQINFFSPDIHTGKGLREVKQAIDALPRDKLPIIFNVLEHTDKTGLFRDLVCGFIFDALLYRKNTSAEELATAALVAIVRAENLPQTQLQGLWELFPHQIFLQMNRNTVEWESKGAYPLAVLQRAHEYFQAAGQDFRLHHLDGKPMQEFAGELDELEAIRRGDFDHLVEQEANDLSTSVTESLPQNRQDEIQRLTTMITAMRSWLKVPAAKGNQDQWKATALMDDVTGKALVKAVRKTEIAASSSEFPAAPEENIFELSSLLRSHIIERYPNRPDIRSSRQITGIDRTDTHSFLINLTAAVGCVLLESEGSMETKKAVAVSLAESLSDAFLLERFSPLTEPGALKKDIAPSIYADLRTIVPTAPLPPHAQELPLEQALSITREAWKQTVRMWEQECSQESSPPPGITTHEWEHRQKMRDVMNTFLRKQHKGGFCPFNDAILFLAHGGLTYKKESGRGRDHIRRFEDDKNGIRTIDFGRYKGTGIPIAHVIGFVLGHGKLSGIGYPEKILQFIENQGKA